MHLFIALRKQYQGPGYLFQVLVRFAHCGLSTVIPNVGQQLMFLAQQISIILQHKT
jgi:hypothetical protein